MPTWLKTRQFKFSASGAEYDTTKERDSFKRPPPLEMFWRSIWMNKIGLHLAYILVVIICLIHAGTKVSHRHHESFHELATDILTHIAWPPLLWLNCLNSFLVPLKYAYRQPTVPNNQQLLKRDPIRQASYPKEIRHSAQHGYLGSREFVYAVTVASSATLLFFTRQF